MVEDANSSAASGVLLLNGLPSHTQVAVDGHGEVFVTNEHFAGIKALPPGWHCLSWTIASTPEQGASTGIGSIEGSVRNVMLRWFEQDEVAVRQLDRLHQRLVDPSQMASQTPARSRRNRLTRTLDASQAQGTIVTPDVLASVEPRLLPLPAPVEAPWRNATRNLHSNGGLTGRKVVAKVFGVDRASGDSATDSLATGSSRAKDRKEQDSLQQTGNQGRQENGKVIWGKSRPPTEAGNLEAVEVGVDGEGEGEDEQNLEQNLGLDEVVAGDKKRKRDAPADQSEQTKNDHDDEDDDDESLLFTPFDLRRSWPPNSTGSDLTRWSHDKSWLLRDVAHRSQLGITTTSSDDTSWHIALLCELELAFVLFLCANNSYAFEQWKDLISLFCRSSSLVGATSPFLAHPSPSPSLPCSSDLTAHVAFVSALHAQLLLLPADFWSTQHSVSEEDSLLRELDALRGNIARSTAAHEQHRPLVDAWRKLSHTATARFSWNLDERLDEEAEAHDDLAAELGEDAPVVVEL